MTRFVRDWLNAFEVIYLVLFGLAAFLMFSFALVLTYGWGGVALVFTVVSSAIDLLFLSRRSDDEDDDPWDEDEER